MESLPERVSTTITTRRAARIAPPTSLAASQEFVAAWKCLIDIQAAVAPLSALLDELHRSPATPSPVHPTTHRTCHGSLENIVSE
jgi:hypothetical protein